VREMERQHLLPIAVINCFIGLKLLSCLLFWPKNDFHNRNSQSHIHCVYLHIDSAEASQ